MASGLLPKSPVSSSLCDEVPHIFIQKSHLEPRECLISSAKRLLQHNLPCVDGSELARIFFTCAALVGAAMCSAFKRSEEHTSELQSLRHLVCRLLLEKK